MADLQHQATFWDNVPEPPDFDSDPMEDILNWLAIFNLPSGENRKIIKQINKQRFGEVSEAPFEQAGQG